MSRNRQRSLPHPRPFLEQLEERCVPTTGWAPQTGGAQSLYRVWGTGPNDVFAVGNNGTIRHSANDGQTWQNQNAGTTQFLYGIWGGSSNDVFAVGAGGVILHSANDGQSWVAQNSTLPATTGLVGVWGSGPNDIFAVGDNGTILHSANDGASWQAQNSGTTLGLNSVSVWGSGSGNVYAVGVGGVILHTVNDGASWTGQSSGNDPNLYAVWGTALGYDEFAVGAGGRIRHSSDDGATWTTQPSGTAQTLVGVWGSSALDLFAVGGNGVILHSANDGASWQAQNSGTTRFLDGVWGSGPGDVFAVGDQGVLLHRSDFEAAQTADTVFAVLSDHSLWQGSVAGGAAIRNPGPIFPVQTQSISAVTDAAGLDILFAVSTDGRLFEHSPSLPAGGWLSLPSPSAGATFQQVSAATNLSGNAVAFATLSDHSLWEYSSLFAGNHWQMLSTPGSIGSVSAVADAAGNDVAYIISILPGFAGTVWEHNPTSAGNPWMEQTNGFFLSLSAGRNGAGQAVVYGVGSDQAVWEQNPAFGPIGLNTGWENLSSDGMPGETPIGPFPAQAVSAGAADDAFAIGPTFGVGRAPLLWSCINASWNSVGNTQGVSTFQAVSATETPSGAGEAFCVGTDGSL